MTLTWMALIASVVSLCRLSALLRGDLRQDSAVVIGEAFRAIDVINHRDVSRSQDCVGDILRRWFGLHEVARRRRDSRCRDRRGNRGDRRRRGGGKRRRGHDLRYRWRTADRRYGRDWNRPV